MTIFSKIINQEIPSYKIYEDSLVYAFLDNGAITKGHTLVIPKEKYENIFTLPPDLAAHLFKVSTIIAKTLKETFGAQGINILSNNGMVAGQTVMHFHLHLIPRYHDSEIKMTFTNNSYDPETFLQIQNSIVKALINH